MPHSKLPSTAGTCGRYKAIHAVTNTPLQSMGLGLGSHEMRASFTPPSVVKNLAYSSIIGYRIEDLCNASNTSSR